jgi:hypothetical protein
VSLQRVSRPAACLAALGCLVLAGCSTGPKDSGPGPLGDGGEQGTLCSPVGRGQVLSDGFDALRNTGVAPVTVEAVSLADPHGLRLLTAYIVPVAGDYLYGVRAGFPPAAALNPGVLWSKRRLAVGASIPRSDGHRVANLVLVLKPTASTGTAGGTQISYRVAGQNYQLQTKIRLVVVVGRQCSSG